MTMNDAQVLRTLEYNINGPEEKKKVNYKQCGQIRVKPLHESNTKSRVAGNAFYEFRGERKYIQYEQHRRTGHIHVINTLEEVQRFQGKDKTWWYDWLKCYATRKEDHRQDGAVPGVQITFQVELTELYNLTDEREPKLHIWLSGVAGFEPTTVELVIPDPEQAPRTTTHMTVWLPLTSQANEGDALRTIPKSTMLCVELHAKIRSHASYGEGYIPISSNIFSLFDESFKSNDGASIAVSLLDKKEAFQTKGPFPLAKLGATVPDESLAEGEPGEPLVKANLRHVHISLTRLGTMDPRFVLRRLRYEEDSPMAKEIRWGNAVAPTTGLILRDRQLGKLLNETQHVADKMIHVPREYPYPPLVESKGMVSYIVQSTTLQQRFVCFQPYQVVKDEETGEPKKQLIAGTKPFKASHPTVEGFQIGYLTGPNTFLLAEFFNMRPPHHHWMGSDAHAAMQERAFLGLIYESARELGYVDVNEDDTAIQDTLMKWGNDYESNEATVKDFYERNAVSARGDDLFDTTNDKLETKTREMIDRYVMLAEIIVSACTKVATSFPYIGDYLWVPFREHLKNQHKQRIRFQKVSIENMNGKQKAVAASDCEDSQHTVAEIFTGVQLRKKWGNELGTLLNRVAMKYMGCMFIGTVTTPNLTNDNGQDDVTAEGQKDPYDNADCRREDELSEGLSKNRPPTIAQEDKMQPGGHAYFVALPVALVKKYMERAGTEVEELSSTPAHELLFQPLLGEGTSRTGVVMAPLSSRFLSRTIREKMMVRRAQRLVTMQEVNEMIGSTLTTEEMMGKLPALLIVSHLRESGQLVDRPGMQHVDFYRYVTWIHTNYLAIHHGRNVLSFYPSLNSDKTEWTYGVPLRMMLNRWHSPMRKMDEMVMGNRHVVFVATPELNDVSMRINYEFSKLLAPVVPVEVSPFFGLTNLQRVKLEKFQNQFKDVPPGPPKDMDRVTVWTASFINNQFFTVEDLPGRFLNEIEPLRRSGMLKGVLVRHARRMNPNAGRPDGLVEVSVTMYLKAKRSYSKRWVNYAMTK